MMSQHLTPPMVFVGTNWTDTFPYHPVPCMELPCKAQALLNSGFAAFHWNTEEQLMSPSTVWVGKDLKDHLVPTPLLWTGNSDRQAAESKELIKFFTSLFVPSKEQTLDSLRVDIFCQGLSEDSFLLAVCFPYFHISRCVIFENSYDERNCLETTDPKQIPLS